MAGEEIGQVAAGDSSILASVLHQKTCQGDLKKTALIPVGMPKKEVTHGSQQGEGHLHQQAHAFPLVSPCPTTVVGHPHPPRAQTTPYFSTGAAERQIDGRADPWSRSYAKTGARPGFMDGQRRPRATKDNGWPARQDDGSTKPSFPHPDWNGLARQARNWENLWKTSARLGDGWGELD
jgi:hypothetical protein